MRPYYSFLFLVICLAGFLAGCGKALPETLPPVVKTTSLPEREVATPTSIPPLATEAPTQTGTTTLTASPIPAPRKTIEPTYPQLPSETPTAAISPTATRERLLDLQDPPLEGVDVLQVQERLLDLGYTEVGWADGFFSAQTEAAVLRFQYYNHLEMSGAVDSFTRQALLGADALSPVLPPPFPGYTLREDELVDVDQALHARLAALKFLAGDAEDWRYERFGAETRAAVLAFQEANGLERTGTVDYETWSALFHPWAIPAEGEPGYLPLEADAWESTIYPLGGEPFDLAFDGQRLWVALAGYDYDSQVVVPVDPTAGARAVGAPIRLDSFAQGMDSTLGSMLFAENRLWLHFLNEGGGAPTLRVLYPQLGILDAPIQFAQCPEGYCFPTSAFGFDGDWLWASAGNQVFGIQPSDARAMAFYEIGWLANGKMVFDGSCMWFAGEVGLTAFNAVGTVDCPAVREAYALPNQAWAFDGQRIWGAGWEMLMSLDVKTGQLGDPLFAGYDIRALAFAEGRLWIADTAMNTVTGLDVNSGILGPSLPVAGSPIALLYDGKGLWVACAVSNTVQYLGISAYAISSRTPSATPTLTQKAIATLPPLTRNLYLTSPRLQGDDVLALQLRLAELGYAEVGAPDGIFGPMTEAAVRHFQEVNDLAVDGVVGPQTWEKLFSPEAQSP